MKNQFKKVPLTIEELVIWIKNPLINPRTGKNIKHDGNIYKQIKKEYLKNKNKLPKIFDLINCHDDRDLLSMNIFWEEINGLKTVVYPDDKITDLVFYYDSKNLLRCFERNSLQYLKKYNIFYHPVTMENIPESIFELIEPIEFTENIVTNEDLSLQVFQILSNMSIFINYDLFLNLSKDELCKFNYEIRDFWIQNFTEEQRNNISNNILQKTNSELENYDLVKIQQYLLNQLIELLNCEKEEYKYMINCIIVGALGIVIPEIKEFYPDFSFSFN